MTDGRKTIFRVYQGKVTEIDVHQWAAREWPPGTEFRTNQASALLVAEIQRKEMADETPEPRR